MTIYNRPDEQVFAKNAEPQDIATFPDLERGWGVTYDDLGGIPPMEWFNFVGKRADEAINYLLQRGVAEWSPTMEYPKQAITIKEGQVFFAKQQNTNKDPMSNPDIWVNSFAQKANVDDVYNKTQTDFLLNKKANIDDVFNQAKSIEDLRTIEPKQDKEHITLLSYYENGVTGGGEFVADMFDKSTEDNGGTVIVTSAGNLWKRVINNNFVSIEMFGAVTDGSQDITEKALKADNLGQDIYYPAGSYIINKDIKNQCYGDNAIFKGNGVVNYKDRINNLSLNNHIRTSRVKDTTFYVVDTNTKGYEWKLGLANDTFNAGTENLESTLHFSHRKSCQFTINAGLFTGSTGKSLGILIKDGVILQDEIYDREFDYATPEVLMIDKNGIMSAYTSKTTRAQDLINKGAVYAVQGWFSIVKNGKYTGNGKDEDTHPKCVIGQKADGSIVMFNNDGRTEWDAGFGQPEIARILIEEHDVVFAYQFDGGGSSSSVVNGVKVNKNIDVYGTRDRNVSSFLYMSKVNNTSDVGALAKEISNLKQEMNYRFKHLIDIYAGTHGSLRFKTTGDNPGIESYTQGDFVNRKGKLWIRGDKLEFRGKGLNGEHDESTYIQADKDGLTDSKGKIGHLYAMTKYTEDLNKILESGMYYGNQLTKNMPAGEQLGSVIVSTLGSIKEMQTQLYVGKGSNKIFVRSSAANGIFSSWREI